MKKISANLIFQVSVTKEFEDNATPEEIKDGLKNEAIEIMESQHIEPDFNPYITIGNDFFSKEEFKEI